MKFLSACALSAAALVLAGCASTGPNSASARPVLYPNAKLNQVGDAQGRVEADACMSRAQSSGLTPDEKNNAAGQAAAKGALVAGVAGAVGALVSGGGVNGMVRSGAGGAAIGGATGAAAGSMSERANGTYRHFVQRCLTEKGFEVIGWN